MKDREKMMKNVQTADFEMIEANLYLDAYPNCSKALEYFYTARDRAEYLTKEYESKYGPLLQSSTASNSTYRWLEEPWPWKYERNEVK